MTQPRTYRRAAFIVARSAAVVSGVFTAVVLVTLLAHVLRESSVDPLNRPYLEERMAELRNRPQEQDLRQEVEELDLLARRSFFASRTFARIGVWLLLAGSVLFLATLKTMTFLGKGPPSIPTGPRRDSPPSRDRAWKAVGFMGFGLGAAALIIVLLLPTEQGMPPPPEAVPSTPPPTPEELLRNWPGFRGPAGTARAQGTDWPLDWDGPSGRGVLWKVPVPRLGFSSPAVWDDKVFLTGGDRRTREVYCFLGKDGRLLWRYAVQPATSTSTLAVTDDTGYAAPSPATDGRHVFAVFATGDLVCLDFQGRRIWGRNLGLPDNPYGHGSSLLVWKDLLLVQYDHGGGNRVMAIRSATGETVWQTPRPGEVSWCSPVLAGPSSPPVLLLNGNPFLTAYAVETGQELWKQECMCGEVATSPAVSQGRVFAANENACLVACDLTTGRVLWESDLDLPDVSSPLAVDGLLIMASSGGVVTCYDGAGGEVLWLHEFDKGFYGSPVLAGGRVYVVDRIGVTRIFMAAKSFSLTGSPALGEPSDGTPAFVGGRIYLRGRDHLFCLGEAP